MLGQFIKFFEQYCFNRSKTSSVVVEKTWYWFIKRGL